MKDSGQILTGKREDTVCCQCGKHVPDEFAMDAPLDTSAWVHIDCPAWVHIDDRM